MDDFLIYAQSDEDLMVVAYDFYEQEEAENNLIFS